jgi:hypothetical protein
MSCRRATLLVLTVLLSLTASAPHSYTTKGTIEVDTNENSLFLWHDDLFLLENIPCYYSQHASKWDPSFNNASYTRIRRVDDGSIVANVSETIGFGFVTPFVDEDHDQLWLFGSACNRCGGPPGAAPTSKPNGLSPSSNGQNCAVDRKTTVWKATSPTMKAWTKGIDAGGTVATYNVVVSRVRANASKQIANGLPPHTYIMILEIGTRYMYNSATDGDLTKGWKAVDGAKPPKLNGGPSIRYSELDEFYYSILGGHNVVLYRTKDFRTWEASATFIAPSAADAQISNFAGFDAGVAAARNFTPMAGATNYTRWDWNSNDADVCCMTKSTRGKYANNSWVIWGAGTQGRAPKPPLTRANHCANVIATAAMSLPELLAAQFKAQ